MPDHDDLRFKVVRTNQVDGACHYFVVAVINGTILYWSLLPRASSR